MELQHVNVKLLIEEPFDLELLIPVFHSWIQGKVFEERLLDIADYRHVPDGPGVILIGHEGDYSVDNADGRLGVRYNRKAALEGGNRDRLRQAARAALSACQRLESEPSLGGKLRFNGQGVEVFINDRLLAPNNEATRRAAEAELRAFFDELFRGAEYSLSYGSDVRRLFGVSGKASRPFSVAELLQNVSG
ncbi:MAG TPA: hypothetical protein VLV49_04325 [Terriglobales bacterium]|nr:hypothetical protein [Terriglobales bacterium]